MVLSQAPIVPVRRLRLHSTYCVADHNSALCEFRDIAVSGNAFVRRVHAGGLDRPLRLKLPRDRERVSRSALHRADAATLVVAVHELECVRYRFPVLRTLDEHSQRDEVAARRLLGMWS